MEGPAHFEYVMAVHDNRIPAKALESGPVHVHLVLELCGLTLTQPGGGERERERERVENEGGGRGRERGFLACSRRL